MGTLLDGTKFDSSVDSGSPFIFKLGQGMLVSVFYYDHAFFNPHPTCYGLCSNTINFLGFTVY